MTWYHAIGPGHSLRRKNEPQGPEEADRQEAMTDIMAPLWTAWDTKDRSWSHSLASMTCWIMSLTMGWRPRRTPAQGGSRSTGTGRGWDASTPVSPSSSAPTSSPAPTGPTHCTWSHSGPWTSPRCAATRTFSSSASRPGSTSPASTRSHSAWQNCGAPRRDRIQEHNTQELTARSPDEECYHSSMQTGDDDAARNAPHNNNPGLSTPGLLVTPVNTLVI